MNKRFLWITILFGLTTFLLLACTPTEEDPTVGLPITHEAVLPPDENLNNDPLSEPIEDREWILTEMMVNGHDISLDATTTLTFGEDGRISGNGGCNSYFGSYAYDGEVGSISVTDVGMTEMACEIGMAQETSYYQSLNLITKVSIIDGALQLSTDDGQTVLILKEVPTVITLPNLMDTMWSLNTIGKSDVASSVIAGTKITLQLSDNGSFAGNSSCNDYNGVYTLLGENQITLEVRGITRRACAEGVDQQESYYIQTLNEITHYQLDVQGLTLYTVDESSFFQFDVQ